MRCEELIDSAFIKWKPYSNSDIICSRFPLDKWHQIAGDIDSDKEWEDFIFSHPNSVRCWVLKRDTNDMPIAFVYIYNEDYVWGKVSIHGGGWESPVLCYIGYIMMLNYLLKRGVKVRTSCHLINSAAIRFSKSVGFVPYRYSEDEVFMWISEQRLKSSKIYKRFYK